MSPNRRDLVMTYLTMVEITSNDLAVDGSYENLANAMVELDHDLWQMVVMTDIAIAELSHDLMVNCDMTDLVW